MAYTETTKLDTFQVAVTSPWIHSGNDCRRDVAIGSSCRIGAAGQDHSGKLGGRFLEELFQQTIDVQRIHNWILCI